MNEPANQETINLGRGYSVEAIAEQARKKQRLLAESVPGSEPLQGVCSAVAEAAEKARDRVRRIKSPFSLAKFRFYILLVGVAWLLWWVYANFLDVRTVRLAVPASDSELIRERARRGGSKHLSFAECKGSAEGIELLKARSADFTVVQGGVVIPHAFEIIGVIRHEHVLYFEKGALPPPGAALRVITFNQDQGSHILARRVFKHWGYTDIAWDFAWGSLAAPEGKEIPPANAAFVVVDPADPSTTRGVRRLIAGGFALKDPYLGAHEAYLPYLKRRPVTPGYYHVRAPEIPAADHRTYVVENYLVASDAITEWQRSEATRALRMGGGEEDLPSHIFHTPGTSVVGDLASLVEATVNLVIIIAALFGLEVLFHRRYLHELNGFISRISLLQAEKDVVGLDDPARVKLHSKYLDVCADLLGLISSIAGYYGEKDASLVFSGLTGTIHGRANDLMINIQLKVLQAAR